jgi:hypothetical protein
MPCFFFRLPRELRDLIYEFALYAEEGLLCKEISDGISRLRRRQAASSSRMTLASCFHRRHLLQILSKKRRYCSQENNQLKYVCKQLYWETRKIQLRINVIIFEDTTRKVAFEQCERRRMPDPSFLIYRLLQRSVRLA